MVDNTWHVGIIAVLRRREATLFEESVVVALLYYLCEDKTNMRQMESRISETVKHNIFQEKFLRFKEQPHHVGDKKHTEHKVVRC